MISPDITSQVATGLLLATLISVLAVATGFAVLAAKHAARRKALNSRKSPNLNGKRTDPSPPVRTPIFDIPCRWLAIRSRSIDGVLSALELHNVTPCSWDEGIAKLTRHDLFVSPPIRGWILVFGNGLPDPSEEIDDCFHMVHRLSHQLGHVQFFSANQSVNHHAWVRATDGQIERAYAWAGETLWNQGKMTKSEKNLELTCLNYLENPEPQVFDLTKPDSPNSEKVRLLAAQWSLDPAAINEGALPAELGVAGDADHFKKH